MMRRRYVLRLMPSSLQVFLVELLAILPLLAAVRDSIDSIASSLKVDPVVAAPPPVSRHAGSEEADALAAASAEEAAAAAVLAHGGTGAPLPAAAVVPGQASHGRQRGVLAQQRMEDAADSPGIVSVLEVGAAHSGLVLRKVAGPAVQPVSAPAASQEPRPPPAVGAAGVALVRSESAATLGAAAAASNGSSVVQPSRLATFGQAVVRIFHAESGLVDRIFDEMVEAHRAVAQLLGVLDGLPCPRVAGGHRHGCHLGCRCGVLQRCISNHSSHSGTVGVGSKQSDQEEEVKKVDAGVCRLAYPAAMCVLGAVLLTLWAGALVMRRGSRMVTACGDSSNGLAVSRAELETRLINSTALDAQQRKAILDQFCSSEEAETKIKPLVNWSGNCGGPGSKKADYLVELPSSFDAHGDTFQGGTEAARRAGTGGSPGSCCGRL